MNKLFYPSIFHLTEEGGFGISFPDLPECFSDGDNIVEAYDMASDALGLALSTRLADKETLPTASSPDQIKLEENEFLAIIEFDLASYRKKHNSKAVKKTLSVPEWLNEEAVSLGINFSQVLQEALIAKIQQVSSGN